MESRPNPLYFQVISYNVQMILYKKKEEENTIVILLILNFTNPGTGTPFYVRDISL